MNISRETYFSPYSCYINLTSKCNLRCKHCFGSYSVHEKNELNLFEWKKIIDDLIKSKVFFVNVSGGEITQSPFFKEFILYLEKRGMHFIITTNGLFSKKTREFILKHSEYLVGIKISLDGPDAESHCFIRLDTQGRYNENIFDITIANIRYFSKSGIPLTIASVVHKNNIGKMKQFRELIKELNPVSWFLSPIIPLGRGDQNRFISEFYEYYNNNFWENLTVEGRKNRINVHLVDLPVNVGKNGVSAYSCAGSISFAEIHSDGTVSPCTLARICIPKKHLSFDNIRDKPLLEIWNGKVFNKFRSYMNRGCDGCTMISKCNKCVAQSFRYFGDGVSPTPFCVKQGERLSLKHLHKYKSKLKENSNLVLK